VRAIHGLALGAAGLFLALTTLLVRGDVPDAALHQRTLGALQGVLLADASLQRDVLRARAGLLGSYDPLVAAIGELRRATEELQAAVAVAEDAAAAAEIAARQRRLAEAVAAREALVEAFKSDNALLRNSVRYFANVSSRLDGPLAEAPDPAAAAAAALGDAMLRFVSDPGADSATRLDAALDQVAGLSVPSPSSLQGALQALATHGRLIASMLPAVDDHLARLLATPVAEQVQALRETYLEQHGRAEARAELSRLLLYLAAVALLAWLGHLVLRLRARLRFERLIAAIAAEFAGLPRERMAEGIRRGLARLAGHLGADRAYVLLPPDGAMAGRGIGGSSLHWQREDGSAVPPEGWPEATLPVCERRSGQAQGAAIRVPRVARLPATDSDRVALEGLGVRAWLCVPMRRPAGAGGGGRIGFLGFEATRGGTAAWRRWRAEDAALLGTAGEIFASALERARAAVEREALEAALHQAQRLEAIGTLAGGIAHDFNNILGAIMGHAEMALEALPRDSRQVRRHVRQVWQAGERARGVIDQILAFGRRGAPERRRQPVRLRALCEEAIGLLRASLPATAATDLRAAPAAAEAVVLGDPDRLQLVVINLCANAVQAMAGRGVLRIRLDAVAFDREVALSHGVLAPGRWLRLAVADTGHGMDAATAARVFEPFFTTRRDRGGTGLGLATTQAVVTDHGGALHLRSRPGAGSTFEVYLPQAEEEAPSPVLAGEAGLPGQRGRGETVLLVDDERPLVLLGEEMLAALGYEPVGFDSAPRALAAFRADPGRFDLALTDEVMPGMTGTCLAAELHRLRPDLPVVLMTGQAGPLPPERLRAAGIREVLRKPLAAHAIARSLARHLRPEPLS